MPLRDKTLQRTQCECFRASAQFISNTDLVKNQHLTPVGCPRAGITTVTSYLVDELNPTGYAQVVEEKTNGALTRVYTYGHDLISQDQLVGSAWSLSYYGYDGHGNVRFLSDPTGEVSDRYTYDAFGQLLTATGTTANRYLYCGEQFDSSMGLYYMRARLMNPLTGRFWTADSYEGQNSDPATLHKYLYANADPINASDPSGFASLSEVQTSTAIRTSLAQRFGQGVAQVYRRSWANRRWTLFDVKTGLRNLSHEFIWAKDSKSTRAFGYHVWSGRKDVIRAHVLALGLTGFSS